MSRPTPDKSADTERHVNARRLVLDHLAKVEDGATREELRFAVATRCGGERFFRTALIALARGNTITYNPDKRWRLARKAAA